MPEFGDEFIIESFNVPWLIWIQLIVTILLIILLLFGFSIFTSDPIPISSASAASPSAGISAAPPSRPNKPSSSHRRINVGDQRVQRDEETTQELIREEDQSEGESPLKDSVFLRVFRLSNHPCSFFGEAKQALLKCFGFDSSSEPSRGHRNEKQE
ncbi:hypothetical protein CASFOL_042708 [Castilleja foliolosa]|uniref:ATP synthase F0 subunit 8 n=1 Tax=Castilleja foliolosa TaxID=1961234 RepID=A0ABD3B7V5_9LAMI